MHFETEIKAAIFDIDDTLYDFRTLNREAIEELDQYAQLHFGWTDGMFTQKYAALQKEMPGRMHFNGSCRNRILRIQKILEDNHLPLSPHAVVMYNLYWDTLLAGMRPREDAEETFSALKERGITIGCCTDMTALMQLRKLETMHLLRYTDFLVSSEEAGEEKPSAAMFRLAAEKAGCLPEECLFVGDSYEKDYKGAKNAGMHALLFGSTPPADAGADAVCELRAVLRILRL